MQRLKFDKKKVHKLNCRSERNLIATFIRAIRNETAIDKHWALKTGVPSDTGIPRTLRFGNFIKKFPRTSCILAATLRAFWFPVALPILILLQISMTLTRICLESVKDQGVGEQLSSVVIASTSRAIDVIPCAESFDSKAVWIRIPYIKVNLPATCRIIKMEAFLRYSDVFVAAKFAWLGARIFSKRKTRAHKLQTYVAFSWFITNIALRQISAKEMWSANHYDRWAVLLDNIEFDKAFRLEKEKSFLPSGGASNEHSLQSRDHIIKNVVQHGLVRNIVQHGLESPLRLPTKLKNTTNLHVDDKNDADDLISVMLATKPLTVVQKKNDATSVFSHYSVPVGYSVLVLIIGHPIYQDVQKEIYEFIANTSREVWFLYKPHPLFKASSKPWFRKKRITVIEERHLYPRVSFVISYNSTLARDYHAANIPVLLHENNTDITAGGIKSQLENILTALKRGLREKP